MSGYWGLGAVLGMLALLLFLCIFGEDKCDHE